MKILNGTIYVEVNDHRFKIHPTQKIILGLRDPPESLRKQYQVENEIRGRKNQKVIQNSNNELQVMNYPENKNQPVQHEPKCSNITVNRNASLDSELVNKKHLDDGLDKKLFLGLIKHYKTISKCLLETTNIILFDMIKYKLQTQQFVNIQIQVVIFYRIGL